MCQFVRLGAGFGQVLARRNARELVGRTAPGNSLTASVVGNPDDGRGSVQDGLQPGGLIAGALLAFDQGQFCFLAQRDVARVHLEPAFIWVGVGFEPAFGYQREGFEVYRHPGLCGQHQPLGVFAVPRHGILFQVVLAQQLLGRALEYGLLGDMVDLEKAPFVVQSEVGIGNAAQGRFQSLLGAQRSFRN